MAIIFEMQIEFDGDFSAQNIFFEYMNDILKPVEINGKRIDFHKPLKTFVTVPANGWTNTSIIPKNVGHALSNERAEDFIEVSDDEMYTLSLRMYDFLRGAPGYTAAATGWEIGMIDHLIPNEEEGASYMPDGLVIHSQKYSRLLSNLVVPFDDEHHWRPLESTLGNIIGEDEE